MTTVFCDKCGEGANKPYCDANIGKSVRSVPFKLVLTEGVDKDNYNNAFGITDEGQESFDLCGTCFMKLRDIITEFSPKG